MLAAIIALHAGAAIAQTEALGLPEATEALSTACRASEGMLAMMTAAAADGAAARMELCDCLVEVLGPQITLRESDLLARELSGTLSSEDRDGYENTEHLGEIAEGSFVACQARMGISVPD